MKKNLSKIILYTFLVVVLLITYLPIIIIFMTSFSNDRFGLSMSGFTFKWYIEMWNSRSLVNSIIYTLQISFLSTFISIIFGTLSAIGINALSRKNKRRFMLLNNIPIINSDIITAVFLLVVFQMCGIILGRNIFGFTTTLIAHVLFSTPYVILSVLPKLSEVSEGIYEASLDLGCSHFKTLYKTILPNLKTSIITGGLLAFTMSIDDFIITHFVTGKGQNFSTWLYGSLKTLRNGLWNQACAYNSLLIIITFVVVFGTQFINIRRKKGRD